MVEVYCADSAGLPEEVLLRWLGRINREKAARIRRMQPKDARASLTGELLLRYGIHQLFGVAPSAVETAADPLGKPRVTSHRGIHFSISHTGSLCLCAVGDVPLGADLQRIKPARHQRIAHQFFSPAELASYRAAGETEDAFFTLWARKEALGKLTGLGLRHAPAGAAPPRFRVELEGTFRNCKVCVLSGA